MYRKGDPTVYTGWVSSYHIYTDTDRYVYAGNDQYFDLGTTLKRTGVKKNNAPYNAVRWLWLTIGAGTK